LSGAITFSSASHYGSGNGTYTNVRIVGNTIGNLTTNRRGISLVNDATGDGSGGDINSPTVSGNNVTGAVGATNRTGIQLIGLVTNANVSNNQFINTDRSFNGAAGGYGTHYSVGTSVRLNNFVNNNVGFVWQGSTALDARYNWWGNETGPTNTANPSGLGDNVSDNVLFAPWLTRTYPPLTPISVFYVNPPLVALQAPALGTSFTVDVTIANVSMMYGFQFTLRWNSLLLNLTNPTSANKIPTAWGNNYISQYNYSLAGGSYSLFEAAKSPAPPFNGTTTVASLAFKSRYDPLYPNSVTCGLTLENVSISDPLARPILRVVQSGNYTCYSVKPRLLFMSSEYSAKKVPTDFVATINVTNVVNLYSIDFTCNFNTTLLNVLNITDVTFPGSPTVIMGWDNNVGYFHISVVGITPQVNGSLVVARVRFKVQQGFVWNTETPQVNGTLDFTVHQLNTMLGPIDHDAISGTYVYRPVPGDLNRDGLVDIVDLLTVAGSFGTSPGTTPYVPADLNHDGVIDIFDIIFVARNFGRTEP
jgi:hypothetical protein